MLSIASYQAIGRALPFSRHRHIEDIGNRIHHHEIPGVGDIGFSRVLKSAEAGGCRHFTWVELRHHNDRRQRALGDSLAYLKARTSGAGSTGSKGEA